MELNELAAIEQIRQLKARYFRLMDQKRWDEWEHVFCRDVHIDTSDGGVGDFGVMDGNATFRIFLEPLLDGVITTHHGHMSEISITSDTTATGVWAMEDHLDYPGDSPAMWGTGWYEETYRLEADGHWRIASLTLTRNKVHVGDKRVWP